MYISIKEDSNKIYFIIFWVLLYFYVFLKFIQIPEIINKNEKK
jgi:hypothetical protein